MRALPRSTPDYSQLDSNIVRLVKALNAFPGVTTIGSCGGHANPGPAQWPQGDWYVKFKLPRNKTGWLALEFLAWAINTYYKSLGRRRDVVLIPTSPPPYLNEPGKCLSFAVEGYGGESPDELGKHLEEIRGRMGE